MCATVATEPRFLETERSEDMSKDMDKVAIVLGKQGFSSAEFVPEEWAQIIEGSLEHLRARGLRRARTLVQGIDDPGGWGGSSRVPCVASAELIRRSLPPGITLGTFFIECIELDM